MLVGITAPAVDVWRGLMRGSASCVGTLCCGRCHLTELRDAWPSGSFEGTRTRTQVV